MKVFTMEGDTLRQEPAPTPEETEMFFADLSGSAIEPLSLEVKLPSIHEAIARLSQRSQQGEDI